MRRSMSFRRFILAVVALVILSGVVIAAVGALSVRSTDDEVNVTIDKRQLREKAEEGAEKVKEAGSAVLNSTGEALRKVGENLRSHSDGTQPPAAAEPASADQQRPAENSPQENP